MNLATRWQYKLLLRQRRWLSSDNSLTNVKLLSLLYTKSDRPKLIYYLFTLTFLFYAFSILLKYRSSRFNREWVHPFSYSVSLNMFHKYRPSGFLRRNSVFTTTSSTLMYSYQGLKIDLWLKVAYNFHACFGGRAIYYFFFVYYWLVVFMLVILNKNLSC